LNKIPIVYLEFDDHASCADWQGKDELKSFTANRVYQVGWLVGEDERVYKVAGQVEENGEAGDVIAILKSTVTKFKKLNVKL
jgi:hypothetical protein